MPDGADDQDQVTFQSPTTGKVQPVAQEDWEDLLNKGYKPVSHRVMYSSAGKRAMVRKEEMRDYMKQGFQSTMPSQEEMRAKEPEKGAWQTAWEDIKAPFQEIGKTFHPEEQQAAIHALPSSIIRENLESMPYNTIEERARTGMAKRLETHGLPYSVAATGLEYATPMNVGGMEEAAEQGHPSEVMGHALGGAIQVAAPEVAHQILPHLPGAAGAVKRFLGENLREPGVTLESGKVTKGKLKPGVKTLSRVAGGALGHAIYPGVGTTLGGAYVGPGIAEMIIPEHPNPIGWKNKVPSRMPKPVEVPAAVPAGASMTSTAAKPVGGEILPQATGEQQPFPTVQRKLKTPQPAKTPEETSKIFTSEGEARRGIEAHTHQEGGRGAVESEGRPATWTDETVLDRAAEGNRAAVAQVGVRGLDKKFAGDPRLKNIRYVMGDIDYRNLVTSPREVTKFTPEGKPIRQEVPGPMGQAQDVTARAAREGSRLSPQPKTGPATPEPVNRRLTLPLTGETPLGGELTPQQERRSLIGTSPTGEERRGQALSDWQHAINTTPPGEKTPGELLGEDIRKARGEGQPMYPSEVPKTGNIVEDVKNALAYEEKTNGHGTPKAEKLREYLEKSGERTAAEEEPESVEAEVKGITAKEPKAKRALANVPDVERMYTADEITDAEGLIKQEIGMMQASDQPGRYFDEAEAGDVRLRSRGAKFKGGDWRGVKSGREMQPFLREHPDWSPQALAKAMRNKDSALYKRAVDAAARWIQAQNEADAAAERAAIQGEATEQKYSAIGEPILPGFGEAVAGQEEGAAKVRAEELGQRMNEPRSIEAQAGRMEQLSPLFRGTEASPQREIFGQEIAPPPETAYEAERVRWKKAADRWVHAKRDYEARKISPDELNQERARFEEAQTRLDAEEKRNR